MYLDALSTGGLITGVPYIELNSQAFVMLRGYESALDKTKLSFLYTVGQGEETPPGMQLDLAPNSTIVLNGGTIMGSATGLDADLKSLPTGSAVGVHSPCRGFLSCDVFRFLVIPSESPQSVCCSDKDHRCAVRRHLTT